MPDPTAAADGGGVVQVVIDSPVPHLARVFDYRVGPDAAHVGPGWRVRVRFAGRLTDALVVGRSDVTEHPGELRAIERVIGVEPVLTPATIALVERVAAHYAGTVSDVLRAAVPPRHARAEAASVDACTWRAERAAWRDEPWTHYDAGRALATRLAEPGPAIRAVWSLGPVDAWSDLVADLVRRVTVASTGGVIVVVPDARDVALMRAALADAVAFGALATLTADAGPQRRYREFVRVLRGGARIVIGTRAAVFAPVDDLRLIVVWDDGDDALVDPQAPYWDARDVAALRSDLEDCHLVVGSPARSVSTQAWCRRGWARSVAATRERIRAAAPIVRALAGEDSSRDAAAHAARIPFAAARAARSALVDGAVLVQVARRGYVPALACQRCRGVARCPCGGPLALADGQRVPQCGWCGRVAADWRCPECGGTRLRAVAVGAERTAEEIGRAFPGVPVVASHAGHIVDAVPDAPAVVVATPGAEPRCPGGYRAVLLLDARTILARPSLDAAEDAARRWFTAARLAAPRAPVVVTAPNGDHVVQALVRWDAPWLADRDLDERVRAGLPPATSVAELTGTVDDVRAVADAVATPHTLLGPVPMRTDESRVRALLSVPHAGRATLADELRAITATRSARRATPVHVRLDPRDL